MRARSAGLRPHRDLRGLLHQRPRPQRESLPAVLALRQREACPCSSSGKVILCPLLLPGLLPAEQRQTILPALASYCAEMMECLTFMFSNALTGDGGHCWTAPALHCIPAGGRARDEIRPMCVPLLLSSDAAMTPWLSEAPPLSKLSVTLRLPCNEASVQTGPRTQQAWERAELVCQCMGDSQKAHLPCSWQPTQGRDSNRGAHGL